MTAHSHKKTAIPDLRRLIVAALLLALAPSALADGAPEAAPKDEDGQIQLFVENDMLAGTDRYYTNGIKFGVGKVLESVGKLLEPPSNRLLHWLTDAGPGTSVGLFVGQNMYTPRNIRIAENQPYDRPWAAWLYLGGVAQRVKADRLDTVELDVGMVGPAALGEQVQSKWHALIGAPQPRGWANQIPNEPAFLVAYLQKRRFGGGNIQVVPHAGVTVGTVMTLARVGGIVRAGHNMTGFGPDTVEPGGAMLQSIRRAADGGKPSGFEWYLFAGGDYRLVVRNIFLDGTLFRDSPSVDRRNTVYDLTVGLALRYKQLNFSLTRVRRSEEFTTPAGGVGAQTFYSLNVGWAFQRAP